MNISLCVRTYEGMSIISMSLIIVSEMKIEILSLILMQNLKNLSPQTKDMYHLHICTAGGDFVGTLQPHHPCNHYVIKPYSLVYCHL